MRIQMIVLSIMFMVVILLVPFPEFDSLQRVFPTESVDSPVVAIQSVATLEQSTSSIEPQEDAVSTDEPLISTLTSDAVPDRNVVTPAGSRTIRETGLEEYQMGISSEDIQESQVSRSDQHSYTPKNSFNAISIHSNTIPPRYGFGFNVLIQKRHPERQRSNIKRPLFMQHIPFSTLDNWNLPRNGGNNFMREPHFPQQVDDRAFRETDQVFRRNHQQSSAPSVYPARRAAGSLIGNR